MRIFKVVVESGANKTNIDVMAFEVFVKTKKHFRARMVELNGVAMEYPAHTPPKGVLVKVEDMGAVTGPWLQDSSTRICRMAWCHEEDVDRISRLVCSVVADIIQRHSDNTERMAITLKDAVIERFGKKALKKNQLVLPRSLD